MYLYILGMMTDTNFRNSAWMMVRSAKILNSPEALAIILTAFRVLIRIFFFLQETEFIPTTMEIAM